MVKLEIACFNVPSAIIAQKNGADRVELCAEMEVGGTTPSIGDIKKVRANIDIDLNVMIRPRGGDFAYSDLEFEQMKEDIFTIKQLRVDGLVFGILREDNSVDVARNKELVDLASPLPCTFHRAFDDVVNMEKSLEDVIDCGFTTILTSGCEPNVSIGIDNLKTLVDLSAGRIQILAGGGLRSNNVSTLVNYTGVTYVHSSAITDGSDTAVAEEVANIKKHANLSSSIAN